MSYFPDVSRYQLDIDFDVMRTKTEYIIFKASQGNFADKNLSRNIAESKRVGLPYGLYHFYDDKYSPSVQAETFAGLANGAVELWCDWESTYGGEYETLRDVVAFMERVEQLTGKRVGMYTGYYWFVDNSYPTMNVSQFKYLAERPLWLAWYTNDHTPKEIDRVKVPKPWSKMTVWQYGTPAIGYEMGAQSKEIDMNLRVGAVVNYPNKPTLSAQFGNETVIYELHP